MRYVDTKKREDQILDLLVESYIRESKPISSSYLCRYYKLLYSSATVRNVMESLEKQGFLSHVYTSSGRVPTKIGFRHYVDGIHAEDIARDGSLVPIELDAENAVENVFDKALDVLSNISGYTSLIGIWGLEERFFFRGTRFILNQPEFEDIEKLRNLFYALEVRIDELQNLLFSCIDEELSILIGDDIGFEEISECSLLVSGLKDKNLALALALLGPMRMDYQKAVSSLYTIKHSLEGIVKQLF